VTGSFTADLDIATAIAARSPSSHNCQPWGLGMACSPAARAAAGEVVGLGSGPVITLGLDAERSLTSLPAHAVEMLLSCGAYWGTLLNALAALGWRARETSSRVPAAAIEPGSGWPPTWTPLCLARLEPVSGDPAALAELRQTALRRRTHRGPYLPDAVVAEVAEAGLADGAVAEAGLADGAVAEAGLADGAVAEAGLADGAVVWLGGVGAGVCVRQVDDDGLRAAVAGLVRRYAGRDFAHAAAWRETHSFIRSPTGALRRGDGFTLEQLFGPMTGPRRLATRAALAPATMRLLSLTGYHRLLAGQLAATVRQSPALTVMSFTGGDPAQDEIIRAGAALARYWLEVTRQGLALHPVSVILQHDDARHALEQRLGLPGRAFFLARLGRPATAASATARRASSATWRSY
jgi:nitroreductase